RFHGWSWTTILSIPSASALMPSANSASVISPRSNASAYSSIVLSRSVSSSKDSFSRMASIVADHHNKIGPLPITFARASRNEFRMDGRQRGGAGGAAVVFRTDASYNAGTMPVDSLWYAGFWPRLGSSLLDFTILLSLGGFMLWGERNHRLFDVYFSL